ncbi:phage repressor protein C with HTH and peptisase S24 domain [Anseongella ginsenosidimutans]|uniref:Phage repressor protein C with HTH and peptisase S24 domain n=1 Tax=Anseongella ginsenosidimutans TaxID=496056 RepID=A0A4R3KWF9_9SPHI|nr:LexA family transcriptional regulator [Anseongella ginsenosidimutans]QEC51217.1 helix-turn-helix domain-containing protein [Anseongella ginsenosidimutans]TCS90109.1 phage repressor protein C with HTH and peptisase S24 domain [Anseongella ginsenosidimutans]
MNEHLRMKALRRALNLSQGDLAKAIGRRQGSISDIERGRNSVDGVTHLLKLAFQANPEWLKTGEGDMFLPGGPLTGKAVQAGLSQQSEEGAGSPEEERNREENRTGVPYFSTKLHEGEYGREEGFSLVNEAPEYYIDFMPFNDCTAYLPYYGESMYPRYLHGDIIAVKAVKNPDIILWGEAYLVITDENANSLKTIRLLAEHKDKKKVILRAVNPAFSGDIVIEKRSILSLHLVKGKITVMI